MMSRNDAATTEHDPHSLTSEEEQRLIRLRKQMREQDRRRYEDPTLDRTLPPLYVAYVWREVPRGRKRVYVWVLAGFVSQKPTPQRVTRWRKRMRIRDDELLRIVDMFIAALVGPGNPPNLTLRAPSKRAARNTRRNKKLIAYVPPRRKPVSDRRLSRCQQRKQQSRKLCTFRAPWSVAYTIDGHRHVKQCCTRHAWDDALLPPRAKYVVRIAREVPR